MTEPSSNCSLLDEARPRSGRERSQMSGLEERLLAGPHPIRPLQRQQPCTPALGRDLRALGGDLVGPCIEQVAHDLPTDRGIRVEKPIDHGHRRSEYPMTGRERRHRVDRPLDRNDRQRVAQCHPNQISENRDDPRQRKDDERQRTRNLARDRLRAGQLRGGQWARRVSR